jgi:hypothetical protein
VGSELPEPGLDGFQVEIAEVALRVTGRQGFALAGAGALVVHGVISRPTQDLDLFSPAEGGPGQASASLLAALSEAGCQVRVLEPAEQHGGEFLRLQVSAASTSSTSTWARDWRQHPPVHMQIGPVLHIDDAVASKATAMPGSAGERRRRAALIRTTIGNCSPRAFRRAWLCARTASTSIRPPLQSTAAGPCRHGLRGGRRCRRAAARLDTAAQALSRRLI